MLFNTLEFLVFFQIVIAVYFSIPHNHRWKFLLLASCYFYMTFVPLYILILFLIIIIDYTAGLLIERSQGLRRKLFLVVSLAANLSILTLFKYADFLTENFILIINFSGWRANFHTLNILLPVGLSFHTFQSISYTMEVYRGRQKAERHLGIYALYVLFFPQMVAGPIERPQNLLPQLHEEKFFEYHRVADGLKLMFWGLFKKAAIADQLSRLVNPVYNHPEDYTGWPLIIATYAFSFQIFCDFSGYSDMARGMAKILGINLMQNFRAPYQAKSVAEFWKRWHISLSTWFRDYLYIPMGGNRVGYTRWCFNLFLVFAISGFWHGANWTFLIWGMLHGSYFLFSIWTKKFRGKAVTFLSLEKYPVLHRIIRILLTFHLVTFAWIFFRANSIQDAMLIIKHLFVFGDAKWDFVQGLHPVDLIVVFFLIFLMEFIQWMQGRCPIRESLSRKPWQLRWTFYLGASVTLLIFGRFTSQEFIYFQF